MVPVFYSNPKKKHWVFFLNSWRWMPRLRWRWRTQLTAIIAMICVMFLIRRILNARAPPRRFFLRWGTFDSGSPSQPWRFKVLEAFYLPFLWASFYFFVLVVCARPGQQSFLFPSFLDAAPGKQVRMSIEFCWPNSESLNACNFTVRCKHGSSKKYVFSLPFLLPCPCVTYWIAGGSSICPKILHWQIFSNHRPESNCDYPLNLSI